MQPLLWACFSARLYLNTIAATLSDIGSRQDNLLKTLSAENTSTRQKVTELTGTVELLFSQQRQAQDADHAKLLVKFAALEEEHQHILNGQKSNKVLSIIGIVLLVAILALLVVLLSQRSG